MDCLKNLTSYHHPAKPPNIATFLAYPIMTFLTLLTNSLVFWLVVKNQRLRSPQNLIIVSLCVVNTLYIVVFISKMIHRLSHNQNTSWLCSTSSQFYKSLIVFTEVHLTIISVDRLVAIQNPFRYKVWLTKKRVVLFFSLIWLLFVSLTTGKIWGKIEDPEEDKIFWNHMNNCPVGGRQARHQVTLLIVHSVKSFAPLLIIVTCYSITFRIAWIHLNLIYPLTEIEGRRRSAIKAARTTVVLILTFFLLYTPAHVSVYFPMSQKQNRCNRPGSRLTLALMFLPFLAAFINPIVYTLTNADYKKAVKKLLHIKPLPQDN